MSIRLSNLVSCTLGASALVLSAAASAFCQGGKSPLALESVDVHVSKTGNQVTTLCILPDGQVFFRNTSPRKMIAAAYNMDESMITGGPDWLDSDRVDVTAKAAPATSQAERLS